MNCCSTKRVESTNKFFSRFSRRYLKRFRKKGLAKEQRLLLEGVMAHHITEPRVLDIGCGVGGLHLHLLKHGAGTAVGVDMAEGMIDAARELAREAGVDERVEYYVGDFVQLNGNIQPADITMLDKVVCCYDDVDTLVEKSLAKTRSVYALSFPRDILPVRWVIKLMILVKMIFRLTFRPYWHDWEEICRKVEESGFREIYRNRTFIWSVRVFRSEQE